MPQLEVNVDSFAYHGPAPREGAPRPLLFATRGQVIDLPEDEAERAQATLVGQVYADPLGGGGSVRRLEPAGIDPGSQSATAKDVEEWNARRAELRAELARLEANAPLTVRAVPTTPPVTARASIAAPVLPPSLTGVREAPAMGDETGNTTPTGPAPSIDVNTASAPQVLGHLTQHPDQVEAIAAAEEVRSDGPRKTVTDAVARVRQAREEQANG